MSINKMKNVVIFPYCREALPMVRYLNKLNPLYCITHLVSPKSFGMDLKDAGEVYYTPALGIQVSDNFQVALEACDLLIIAECKQNENIMGKVIENIKLAMDLGKDIICTAKIADKSLDHLFEKSKKTGTKLLYYPGMHKIYDEVKELNLSYKLYQATSPIIFIGELYHGLDGFEVLLAATYYYRKNGYKVASIGERENGEVYNIYSMPSFMNNPDFDDVQKINQFNNFIKVIEETDKPDIIFIQMPGAIMKYNDMFTNNFGVLPYLISQAIQGDFLILCSQYDCIDTKFFEMLNKTSFYRFGVEINCIHMSNTMIDVQESIQEGKLSVLNIKQDLVDQEIEKSYRKSTIPVYNCYKKVDADKMFYNLEETLLQYGTAKTI